MTLNRKLLVALTMGGGSAIAAILAYHRRERQLKHTQHKADSQRWYEDTGNPAKSVVECPLS